MPNYIKVVGVWIVVILFSVVFRNLILQGSPQVSLQGAPPLSGAISQSLGKSTTSKNLPELNKDFTIKNTQYFQNNTFAVVNMIPANQSSNTTFIIMQKVNGAWKIVLGPGTAFSADEALSLPSDVTQYLTNSGVLIYSPAGGS